VRPRRAVDPVATAWPPSCYRPEVEDEGAKWYPGQMLAGRLVGCGGWAGQTGMFPFFLFISFLFFYFVVFFLTQIC
jgi:hypothetical protein